MRKWVTGVSIVTAEYDDLLYGMTVGSLVSVSIDPPRVVVTLANHTRTQYLVERSGLFGVTLLSASQESIAERFANSSADPAERMAGIRIKRVTMKIPVLEDGLGYLACRVVHQYAMSNSTLFVAEVLEGGLGVEKTALVYGNRSFRQMEL